MKDKADPPSAVGGLEAIAKRVGSWGKKKAIKTKAKEKAFIIKTKKPVDQSQRA